jgi:hypothetical protein
MEVAAIVKAKAAVEEAIAARAAHREREAAERRAQAATKARIAEESRLEEAARATADTHAAAAHAAHERIQSEQSLLEASRRRALAEEEAAQAARSREQAEIAERALAQSREEAKAVIARARGEVQDLTMKRTQGLAWRAAALAIAFVIGVALEWSLGHAPAPTGAGRVASEPLGAAQADLKLDRALDLTRTDASARSSPRDPAPSR